MDASRPKGYEARDVKPHVLILGSGTSVAATPTGDRNGVKLPTLAECATIPAVKALLANAGIQDDYRSFEALFSKLHDDPRRQALVKDLEIAIHEFFSQIEIPDQCTVYDHLLLALRPKDMVATFNWDPLLVQAHNRLTDLGAPSLPDLRFLHGNVAVGYCAACNVSAARASPCPQCLRALTSTRLLYPIEKDYSTDPFISTQMTAVLAALRNSLQLTIFGYSGPRTDAVALGLFGEVFLDAKAQFTQLEVIDLPGAEATKPETWDSIRFEGHYATCRDLFSSTLGVNPRRTIEDFEQRHIHGRFSRPAKTVPRNLSLQECVDWYSRLTESE